MLIRPPATPMVSPLMVATDPGTVTVVPWFDGERTPNVPDATGSLLGVTNSTTRAQIALAAHDGPAPDHVVSELEEVERDIAELLSAEPARAIDLCETFVAGCYEKAEEIDDSSGSFAPRALHRLRDVDLQALSAADFDLDGDFDVLAGINKGRAKNLGYSEFDVAVFLSSNDYRDWEAHLIDKNGIYNGWAADLEGDGDMDIFRLHTHDDTQYHVLVNTKK